MKFNYEDMKWAEGQGLITKEQVLSIKEALTKKYQNEPRFNLGNVIYYFGALIIISAMTWLMLSQWDSLGGAGIATLGLGYASLFFLAGAHLWKKPAYKIPGGLFITAAVSLTPLIVYGFQKASGFWLFEDPGSYHSFYVWMKSGWLVMEVATIAVGALALYFFRFPFITMPIAVALYFMSMDLAMICLKGHNMWEFRKQISLWFGLAMIGVTYFFDRRSKEDFGFWGYLFGVLAFWGGLTSMDSNSELAKLGYCFLNVVLVFASVFLSRRVFAVFGALGVCIYLGDIAHRLFPDSVQFPMVLAAIGAGIIALGMLYQKNSAKIADFLNQHIPEPIQRLRPTVR